MIIIVCGTSSSGKSSVCQELKNNLGDQWLLFSTDSYLSMLGNKFLELHPDNKNVDIPNDICYAKKYADGTFEIIPGELCSKLYLTIPAVLKLLSEQGFHIILDSFITIKEEFTLYKNTLKEVDLFFVYLNATEREIKDREQKRRNRLPGSAIHWLKKFNFQEGCDLVVDTEQMSIQEICDSILRRV